MTGFTDALEQNKLLKNLARNRNDDSVYVINMSDRPNRAGVAQQKKGMIAFQVTTQTGETFVVKIPNTWAPFDLTMGAQKADILASREFLKMINQGMIQLMPTEKAEELLKKPEYRDEYNRAMAEVNGAIKPTFDGDNDEDRPREASLEDKVQAFLVETLDDESGWDDSQRYSAIRNRERELTKEDCEYILIKSKNDKIKQIAVNRMKLLEG